MVFGYGFGFCYWIKVSGFGFRVRGTCRIRFCRVWWRWFLGLGLGGLGWLLGEPVDELEYRVGLWVLLRF